MYLSFYNGVAGYKFGKAADAAVLAFLLTDGKYCLCGNITFETAQTNFVLVL